MQVSLEPDAKHGGDTAGVLTVVGEVDADNRAEFGAALLAKAPPGELVVVDLAGLTFIDSSGIGELLRISDALGREGRRLSIRDPSPAVERVLRITGLLEHFGLA